VARNPFDLSIVTPAGSSFEGEVVSLVFPGEDGYIGVWARHAPMLSSMRPGILKVRPREMENLERHYAVGSGFAEVSDNKAILLVDSCESAEEIDLDRAQRALERAKQHLREAARDPDIDAEQAHLALERAEARIRAAYERGV
jgi:F-type H+-transporting ATPase subunit epsilon